LFLPLTPINVRSVHQKVGLWCASDFLNIVRLGNPKKRFFNLTDNTDMGTMEAKPSDRCDNRFDWLLPAVEPSTACAPPSARTSNCKVWTFQGEMTLDFL